MPIQHYFLQGNERTSLLKPVETQLRAGRFRAIEQRSSAFFNRIRSVSDASAEESFYGPTSWLNQPSRTSLRRVLGSFIGRHLVLTILPCAVVLLWCSIPFPQQFEQSAEQRDKPTTINFWFFLFFYYGFYNLIGLLWITKLFNLYALNWWPTSLGGTISYFIFWSLSVVLGALIYLVTGLDKYTLTWVLLTFVTMGCPIVAAFLMLLKARRFRTRGIAADQVFEESYSGLGVPASYLRFLWFCTAVILALVTFVLGETYAWIYFSTLPHSNVDALLYVYSWVGTIHLLDGLTGWILSNRVENYPIVFAFKFYYSLTYQIYVRNLYARLRTPEQFLIVQLASFIGVIVLSPLQMTYWAHKLTMILTNSSSELDDYRQSVGRAFFLRNLAENVTMVSFLGWVTILHFGTNRHVYPYFSFEETTDQYTYKLTFYASLVIWLSEVVSSFITRYIMRRAFKHNVTEEAMKDFERYPDLLPCSMEQLFIIIVCTAFSDIVLRRLDARMNDFTYVQRKNGRRKAFKETQIEDYITEINSLRERIATSELMAALIQHIKTSDLHWQHIHCLALGSPSMFVKSRLQLAFILEVSKLAGEDGISIFDPRFNDQDIEIFKLLDIEVEESIDQVLDLLIFLPHAPLWLIERVLSPHANPIICNDLDLYLTRYIRFVSNELNKQVQPQ